MYSDDMAMGSWANLRGLCSARHVVNDGDSVEFSFRSGSKTLDIAFDAQNLEAFVRLGSAALREMRDLRSSPPA
jgi:hypothetical protein